MPFYGPQAGQKRAMAARRGGRREQIEPQAKRQREEGRRDNHLGLGAGVFGVSFCGINA